MLPRAQGMHHAVDGFDNVVSRRGLLVDFLNCFSHTG
jgi:hypothetical protein